MFEIDSFSFFSFGSTVAPSAVGQLLSFWFPIYFIKVNVAANFLYLKRIADRKYLFTILFTLHIL